MMKVTHGYCIDPYCDDPEDPTELFDGYCEICYEARESAEEYREDIMATSWEAGMDEFYRDTYGTF